MRVLARGAWVRLQTHAPGQIRIVCARDEVALVPKLCMYTRTEYAKKQGEPRMAAECVHLGEKTLLGDSF